MWPYLGPVKTWTALYILSIISFFFVSRYYARGLRLRRSSWITLGIIYLVGMTLGAKVLYDLQHARFSFLALFTLDYYISCGMWGGIMAYLALAVPTMLILIPNKHNALDLVALSLPIPLLLTKVGCLANGCCYGTASSMPWALTFPEEAATSAPGIPTHPTQAYEILVAAGIIIVFAVLDRERWRGTMLFWFLIMYGLGRAATEVFRADLPERGLILGPLSLSQLLCLAAAVVSTCVLVYRQPQICGLTKRRVAHARRTEGDRIGSVKGGPNREP